MSRRARVALAAAAIVLLAAIGLYAWVDGHGFDARAEPGPFESSIALRLRRMAIPEDARGRANPEPQTEETFRAGLAHFADHCATCHSNDGSGTSEIGRGLYPRPPDMRLARTQTLTDGELFYIIERGVPLTGMPGFGTANEMTCRQQKKMTATGALAEPITLLIGSLAFAAVLYIATQPSMRDEITVGTFMSFMTALMLLFAPMKRLTKINTTVQSGIAAAHSIFEFLDAPEEKDGGTRPLDRARGQVEFRNVSFLYQGGAAEVLERVSFVVEPGQTVAVVGRSGSGKSTLVSLLPRFYDVTGGMILLDGIDLREADSRPESPPDRQAVRSSSPCP